MNRERVPKSDTRLRVSVSFLHGQVGQVARNRIAFRIVLPHREWVDMRSQRVSRAFGLDGSTDRVVLFSWSSDPAPRKRNVARIDRHGNVVWRAELPSKATADCFNSLERDGDGFVARTWSEWVVYLHAEGQVRDARRGLAAA